MATHRINHHGPDDSLDNVVEQHANKRLKKIQEEQAKAYERGHHHADDYDDVLEVGNCQFLIKTIKKLKNCLQKTKNGLK